MHVCVLASIHVFVHEVAGHAGHTVRTYVHTYIQTYICRPHNQRHQPFSHRCRKYPFASVNSVAARFNGGLSVRIAGQNLSEDRSTRAELKVFGSLPHKCSFV